MDKQRFFETATEFINDNTGDIYVSLRMNKETKSSFADYSISKDRFDISEDADGSHVMIFEMGDTLNFIPNNISIPYDDVRTYEGKEVKSGEDGIKTANILEIELRNGIIIELGCMTA